MVAPEIAVNELNNPIQAAGNNETNRNKKIGKLCREAYRVLKPNSYACFTYYDAFFPDLLNPANKNEYLWLWRIIFDELCDDYTGVGGAAAAAGT